MSFLATTDSQMRMREVRNMERSKKIAAEGMVLLKNSGVLPLKDIKKIALFGNGVRHTIKGGTGSGGVNSRFEINVEQGFKKMNMEVTTSDWLDSYDAVLKSARDEYYGWLKETLEKQGGEVVTLAFDNPFNGPDMISVSDEDVLNSETDTAIYVLSRNSGEGKDRRVGPGDYELTEAEKTTIGTLAEKYPKFIVVLNVGGVIDTSFIEEIKGIDAVLLMSQPGNMGGFSLAEVLCGMTYPSGHLTTTWAKKYSDYPSALSFSYLNNDLDDEYYKEGIYVGYRYFDTFNISPGFEFGYGLSYTKFDISVDSVSCDAVNVNLKVRVKNVGDEYAGKEVVQVYYSAPSGRLEKPYQELAAFKKSKELAPGESEHLEISFAVNDMASYDEKMASYLLEAGEYVIRVGNSSRNTHVAGILSLDTTVATEILSNKFALDVEFDQLYSAGVHPYSYDGEASEMANAIRIEIDSEKLITNVCDYEASYDDLSLVDGLEIKELVDLCVGTARNGSGESAVVGSSSMMCPGAAGDTYPLPKHGIGSLIMADGPAGLRLSRKFAVDSAGRIVIGSAESAMSDLIPLMQLISAENEFEIPTDAIWHYQYTTALPVATCLAQTWNEDLLKEAGNIVGEEMEEFGINLWLAPGLNIHRNPLCGRNFEYYSEDPLVSGKAAAAVTKGVQRHKTCGTTLKHFAFNNQEDNRMHTNAHISERAIREIYLKGFEIAVKESQPVAIMSSYNLINGVHTANSPDLLTSVLRGEWGYEGFVMTDWSATGHEGVDSGGPFKYGYSESAACIKAGNDLIMPGNKKDVESILEAVGSEITLEELKACAGRVVKAVKKLNK